MFDVGHTTLVSCCFLGAPVWPQPATFPSQSTESSVDISIPLSSPDIASQPFILNIRVVGSDDDSWTEIQDEFIAGEDAFTVRNLSSSTMYEIRVRFVNGSELSPWSSTIPVSTTEPGTY